jgi:hypothetical protein
MMFGYLLIILGIFILLKAMGIIMGDFWGYFWGILFLVMGFGMINKKGDRCCWGWCSHKKDHHKDELGQ